jgi:hypothetical protein
MIPIQTTLIAAAASLAIGLGAGWAANGWRLNGKIDRMNADASQALVEAGKNAMLESARLQKLKDEALDEANKIAQKNAADATRARTELERVRRELANRATIGNASCASTRDYAATLAVIFGECATRIGEMAEAADGHALDSRTLQQSWPRK